MTSKKQSTVRKIQLLELEAIKELKSFCEKNSIKFFLRGGSVMGAVKYHGFVPWDDDADIAVPREQYDKLIELSHNINWSNKFYIESFKYNDNMHCYFPRVLVKDEYLKKLKLPVNNELGLTIIDILPLDGTPDNKLLRELYFIKVYIYRALAGVWTLSDKKTVDMHDKKKKLVLKILKILKINKLYSQKSIYFKLDKLYKKYDYRTHKNIGTITGSLYKKEIFPCDFWGAGKLLDFEDIKLLVPDEYDKYLKKLYGEDYLFTTPSEKQKNFKQHIKNNN